MRETVDKCLAFCQALVKSKQKLTFSISIGKDTFSFDNRDIETSSLGKKKKKSASQLWRAAKEGKKKSAKRTEKVVEDFEDAFLKSGSH